MVEIVNSRGRQDEHIVSARNLVREPADFLIAQAKMSRLARDVKQECQARGNRGRTVLPVPFTVPVQKNQRKFVTFASLRAWESEVTLNLPREIPVATFEEAFPPESLTERERTTMMTEYRRRSIRFPLEFPALLRWQAGRLVHTVRTNTKNISRSGIYILLKRDQQPSPRIEFEVELPPTSTGEPGAVLRGKGRLLRREDLGNQVSGFAAAIDRYEFISTGLPSAANLDQQAEPVNPAARNPAGESSTALSAARR